MRADSRFGGHFVQGHVDGTGTVGQVRPEGDAHWLTIAFAEELAPYLIRKGSIAVDGVSLTVADLRDARVRRDDRAVHVDAHELSALAASGRPRESRMRHGREVRGARGGIGAASRSNGPHDMRFGVRTTVYSMSRRSVAGGAEVVSKQHAEKIRKSALPRAPAGAGRLPPIEEAVDAIRAGRMIIVVDDEDRENEGDLTIAAEKVTPDAVNFMAQVRARPDLPADDARAARSARDSAEPSTTNTTPVDTAFCVPIDAKRRISTGISAADRAHEP